MGCYINDLDLLYIIALLLGACGCVVYMTWRYVETGDTVHVYLSVMTLLMFVVAITVDV